MMKEPAIIKDDQDAVQIIDQLKYALKIGNSTSKIAQALDNALNDIINRFALDTDKDAFATLPKELPAVIFPPSEVPSLPGYRRSAARYSEDVQKILSFELQEKNFRDAVLEYLSPYEGKTKFQMEQRILAFNSTTEYHPGYLIGFALDDLVEEGKVERITRDHEAMYRRLQ